MMEAWHQLRAALGAVGPALVTFLLLSTIHAYSKRGMSEFNVPPRFKIGTRTIEPLTTIPLDLFVAVVTLPVGLARHGDLRVMIGLGALTYYAAGMLQILVRIPRESVLYEMEFRSMLAARVRNPDHAAEISETFEHNVSSLCANLPAWQKRRIELRVAKTPLPRWTAGVTYDTATGFTTDDGLSEAQRKAVQLIFDEMDRADLEPLARYEGLLQHLRRCRTDDGLPFPEVERAFIQKLDQLSAKMDPDDVVKAASLLANYACETYTSEASKSGKKDIP